MLLNRVLCYCKSNHTEAVKKSNLQLGIHAVNMVSELVFSLIIIKTDFKREGAVFWRVSCSSLKFENNFIHFSVCLLHFDSETAANLIYLKLKAITNIHASGDAK